MTNKISKNKITKQQLEHRLDILNNMADVEYSITISNDSYCMTYDLDGETFFICEGLTRFELWHQLTGMCKALMIERQKKGLNRNLKPIHFDSHTLPIWSLLC